MSQYPQPVPPVPALPDQPWLKSWLAVLTKVEDVQLVAASDFQNGWDNVGSPYLDAGYYKDPWGRVYLQGKITSANNNTVAFTLPEGYRPKAEISFTIDDSGSIAYATVEANGDVTVVSSSTPPDGHLDQITFRAT